MHRLESFYRGKRVLVTGNTGFKGSWLTLWLTELGAEVHGYSLPPPTTPSLFQESGLVARLASHTSADIRDREPLEQVIQWAKPELVFHLAAQPLVRRSYLQPRETLEINCLGTVNMLEAVRLAGGVRVCQIITTDKCYQNPGRVYAFREDDPLGGSDPYSASKACAELVAAMYRRSFFPPEKVAQHGTSVATARAGNVIGGGDWAEDRIIPDCIRALEQNKPIGVRNPAAIRPWQHVLEPLSGYLHLAMRQWQEPAACADAWNFGPLPVDHWTVSAVVEQVLWTWGEGSWVSTAPEKGAPALHEAPVLKLDITKAVTLLNWRPVYSVDRAVTETVGWYRQRHAQGGDFQARRACVEQIRAFTASAARAGLVWAIPASGAC